MFLVSVFWTQENHTTDFSAKQHIVGILKYPQLLESILEIESFIDVKIYTTTHLLSRFLPEETISPILGSTIILLSTTKNTADNPGTLSWSL